jgi:Beta/Gamma crystallin
MAELPPEVILFEHENFRGAHRHVFTREDDLSQPQKAGVTAAGGSFGKITSSVVVVRGTWLFFTATGCDGHAEELGPGPFPNFKKLPIAGDSIRSLRPKT